MHLEKEPFIKQNAMQKTDYNSNGGKTLTMLYITSFRVGLLLNFKNYVMISAWYLDGKTSIYFLIAYVSC